MKTEEFGIYLNYTWSARGIRRSESRDGDIPDCLEMIMAIFDPEGVLIERGRRYVRGVPNWEEKHPHLGSPQLLAEHRIRQAVAGEFKNA